MKYSKQEILDGLRNGVIMVSFTKTDGTLRVMRCTLNDDYIPEKNTLIEATPRAINPDQIKVWDVVENAWRSFNINSVLQLQIL